MNAVPTLPTSLLPLDGAVVTTPPAFSWIPGQHNDETYLNVSTSPTLDPVTVVNWKDDGSHYHRPEDVAAFENLKGLKVYWRLSVVSGPHVIHTPVRSCTFGDVSLDPYYHVIHFPHPAANPPWNPADLTSVTAAQLERVKNELGNGGVGKNPDRKLAVSFHIPYFFDGLSIGHCQELITRAIASATDSGVPILFGLDGFQYWVSRPDLWNWWDPAQPGFDPENRLNVEWTSWSDADAVKIGTYNWGVPLSKGAPHPNLAAPQVIEANRLALRQLAPAIRAWVRSLPAAKRFLFAGVKVGWEVNIGANYYYPVGADDTHGRFGYQIGYAAVKTAGIRDSGELQVTDLTRAIQFYLEAMSRELYEAGLPRHKLFTHAGAWPEGETVTDTGVKFAGPPCALNRYAQPGWSFYQGVHPPSQLGIDPVVDRIAGTHWANCEWGGNTSADYAYGVALYSRHRHNKFTNVFQDFDGVAVNPALKAQLSTLIDQPLYWMHPPVASATTSGRSAVISWSAPSQAEEVYLNVTTDPTPSLAGGFEVVNVENRKVSGQSTHELLNLADGEYYYKLFADGLPGRVVSETGQFKIHGQ